MSEDGFLISEGIEASYGKKKVLYGVSVEVKKREIVSIIGPNGAGKSTFLKVVFGLLKPSRGRIIFLDKDITKNNPMKNRKSGISYFIQGGEVFTNLSIEENLEMGCYASGEDYKIEEWKKEMFRLFPQLYKYRKRRAGLLSGGEKQMLALCIALIRRPKLMLLDEPSAGLAPLLVKQITRKIKQIRDDFGFSVLLVEQNIKQALSISDRVYLLRMGRVEACDVPEKIIKDKMVDKIFFA